MPRLRGPGDYSKGTGIAENTYNQIMDYGDYLGIRKRRFHRTQRYRRKKTRPQQTDGGSAAGVVTRIAAPGAFGKNDFVFRWGASLVSIHAPGNPIPWIPSMGRSSNVNPEDEEVDRATSANDTVSDHTGFDSTTSGICPDYPRRRPSTFFSACNPLTVHNHQRGVR